MSRIACFLVCFCAGIVGFGQSDLLKLAEEDPEQFLSLCSETLYTSTQLNTPVSDSVIFKYVEVCQQVGSFDEAEFWGDSLSTKVLKGGIENTFEFDVIRTLATAKKNNQNYENALYLYTSALAYKDSIGHLDGIVNSMVDIAELYRAMFNTDLALSYIDKARMQFQDTVVSPLIYARLLSREAAILNEAASDKDKVIALCQEALEIAQANNHYDLIATLCNELGSVLPNIEAEDYLIRAINNFELVGNRFAVYQTKINLARVYNNTKREAEGRKLVEEVLQVATEEEWFLLQWWAHEYLAITCAQLGQWEKSAFHVNRSLHMSAMHQETRHQRNLRIEMAKLEADITAAELKVQRAAFEKVNAELNRTTLERTYILGLGFALLIVLITLFVFYRRAELAKTEIAEQKQLTEKVNEELKSTLKQRETLIQEVHHRVKNNLQLISSMLNMQKNTERDGHTIQSIENAQKRVHSIALIHERLYQHDSLNRIDFKEYVEELISYLKGAVSTEKLDLTFKINTLDVSFEINQSIPLGLILNEVVTNAVKYAFPDRSSGTINVSLEKEDDQHFKLIVSDDGIGFDKSEMELREGIGTKLIRMLVRQLRAEYSIQNQNGTIHSFIFPIK